MVDDEELEKLRKQKREQLEEQEDVEDQLEKQKRHIWSRASQYMTGEARNRLANVKAVNEEKALAVARQIVTLGDSNRIKEVDEEEMKQILKSLQNQNQPDIKFRG